MRVKDLIKELLEYNMDAEVSVIVHDYDEDFTLSYGSSEGVTKKTADTVSLYVDRPENRDNLMKEYSTKQYLTTQEILAIEDRADKFSEMYAKGDRITNNTDLKQIIKELDAYLGEVLANNNMNRGELRTIGIICKPAKDKGLNQDLWNELINRLNENTIIKNGKSE